MTTFRQLTVNSWLTEAGGGISKPRGLAASTACHDPRPPVVTDPTCARITVRPLPYSVNDGSLHYICISVPTKRSNAARLHGIVDTVHGAIKTRSVVLSIDSGNSSHANPLFPSTGANVPVAFVLSLCQEDVTVWGGFGYERVGGVLTSLSVSKVNRQIRRLGMVLHRFRTLALAIGGLIVAGIVGNRADAGLLSLWPRLLEAMTEVPLLTLVALALIGVIGFQAMRQRQRAQELDGSRLLLELDDTLLRLIPSLLPIADGDEVMRKLLYEYLRDSMTLFAGRVTRASVLRPEKDWLVAWQGYGMPPESLAHRFYIGGQEHLRRQAGGTAGEAFVTGQLKVVHFVRDGTGWIPRPGGESYIEFEPRPYPPYRSFIAIPLAWEGLSIGILCFDSMDETIFDSIEMRDALLRPLSRRLAAAIVLYRRLQENRPDGQLAP